MSLSSRRSFLLTDDVTSLLSEVSIPTRICILGPYFLTFFSLSMAISACFDYSLFFYFFKTNLPVFGTLCFYIISDSPCYAPKVPLGIQCELHSFFRIMGKIFIFKNQDFLPWQHGMISALYLSF